VVVAASWFIVGPPVWFNAAANDARLLEQSPGLPSPPVQASHGASRRDDSPMGPVYEPIAEDVPSRLRFQHQIKGSVGGTAEAGEATPSYNVA
jgi:hypothetical protein